MANGTPIPTPISALAPAEDGREDCRATEPWKISAAVAVGAIGHATVVPDLLTINCVTVEVFVDVTVDFHHCWEYTVYRS